MSQCPQCLQPVCSDVPDCPISIEVGTYAGFENEELNVVIEKPEVAIPGANVETDVNGLLIITFGEDGDFPKGIINSYVGSLVLKVYHEGVLLTGTDEDDTEADCINLAVVPGLTDLNPVLVYNEIQ